MALSTPQPFPNDNQQTHDSNTQPATIIRDFAYKDPNASYPPLSEASIAKPFSNFADSLAASSLATSISTKASSRGDNDSNILSYTTFYDPAWTINSEASKGKGREAPALVRRPAEIGTTASEKAKVDALGPSNPDRYYSRTSENSRTSHNSQYSTQAIYSERHPSYRYHALGMGGVPLATLMSGIGFESSDSLRPTISIDSNPDVTHKHVSSDNPLDRDGDLDHQRHESRESEQTISSSYSKYST